VTNVADVRVAEEGNDILERSAHTLAEEQRDLHRAPRMTTHFFEPPQLTRSLDRVRKRLNLKPSSEGSIPKTAEWFLDNDYLIRRVARQVEEELPRGFVRHLPLLASGPNQEKPRIEVFGQALVAESSMLLDGAVLRRFIDAYQVVSPLSIAELWALPTMLRSTVLKNLVDVLENADATVTSHNSDVERCVRALRVLDTLDWNILFETTNKVESVLRTDPAHVYEQMDFDTRDSYRKVVEALAWSTGKSEEDVANTAIGLANAADSNERRGHVGYYLKEADGRKILEHRLEYRAVGIERVRAAALSSPTFFYLVPLATLTLVPLFVLGGSLATTSASALIISITLIASLVPFSAVAIAILHLGYAKLLTPRTLPKLDFSKGLPNNARTLVVIPTLLGRAEDVASMIRQIELHYLSNPDLQIQFALLTDDVDTKVINDNTERDALLESVTLAIVALNAKHSSDGHAPFHLLHRELLWNPGEDRFMGWERKRGKLEELNKLLRGDPTTSFSRHVGDPRGLLDIQYVITLDSDTELPIGSAHRLVGILAHPLNHAVFDEKSDRVVAGYTVIQPRIETSPSSFRQTAFSRIFAGDIGFDIYTHASSELYQDLFGSGIYVGKGIYDVDSFRRSVDGRAPENSLVSHDLFEGIQGRAALATDVVLFECYPSSYATYAMRMHRWIRGDWQLFPWLLPKVPTANGKRLWNSRAHIDRWKMLDNLRRSLTSPSFLILFFLSWTCLPGSAALWAGAVLGILVAPFVPELVGGRRMRMHNLARVALAISFLAYEASVVLDAIARVLIRKVVTGKNLLQWTSAAHAAFGIKNRSSRIIFWRTMFPSPALALAVSGAIAWRNPTGLLAAAPILVVWLLAPEIARSISTPLRPRAEEVTLRDRKRLRMLARRTWRFFDAFVGPGDQWLPVDNHQDQPREQTAHRTSPTNIGLMMVATVSAYDFGYIGPSQLAIRLRRAFESISRMQHYQGHLLNWYDTKSLQPLMPRYVSTVDSGNFAGCLVALKQGCADVAGAPVLRVEAWDGLRDSLDLLEEVVESAPTGATQSLRSVIARMHQATLRSRDRLDEAYATLQTLNDETLAELDRELLAFLETGACRHEADLLVALRTSSARLHQQLRQMRVELDALTPWLALKEEAAVHHIELPTNPRLNQTAAECARLRAALDLSEAARKLRGELSPELDQSSKRLYDALSKSELNASALKRRAKSWNAMSAVLKPSHGIARCDGA
jgi:cyclic beta-1,2-glucan synthetase